MCKALGLTDRGLPLTIAAELLPNHENTTARCCGAGGANGFDLRGLLLLAMVPIVSAVIGLWRFERRDLMV